MRRIKIYNESSRTEPVITAIIDEYTWEEGTITLMNGYTRIMVSDFESFVMEDVEWNPHYQRFEIID